LRAQGRVGQAQIGFGGAFAIANTKKPSRGEKMAGEAGKNSLP